MSCKANREGKGASNITHLEIAIRERFCSEKALLPLIQLYKQKEKRYYAVLMNTKMDSWKKSRTIKAMQKELDILRDVLFEVDGLRQSYLDYSIQLTDEIQILQSKVNFLESMWKGCSKIMVMFREALLNQKNKNAHV